MYDSHISKLKLGPGAAVLNVPENAEFLKMIETEKDLSPEQLLGLARKYRDYPTTAPLAAHLAACAMEMLVQSPRINQAMKTIEKTEIEWSWWGDAWDAVKNFFTGGGGTPTSPCKHKCIGFALLEKCGSSNQWHIIGICFGFDW